MNALRKGTLPVDVHGPLPAESYSGYSITAPRLENRFSRRGALGVERRRNLRVPSKLYSCKLLHFQRNGVCPGYTAGGSGNRDGVSTCRGASVIIC